MVPAGPPPRRRIQRLDEGTVSRIAAGEVVERPASVVKELVENAVDANASQVDVRIEGGGIERIEVADDGVGIPPDELPLAIERYATSKLPPSDPLVHIESLGFRGEALSSIAAVSRFRLFSRTSEADSASGISVIGGIASAPFEIGRAPGTTVEVRELFFATPARRKFLKSPAAEQVEIVDVLESLYLAGPSVGISLSSQGREILRFPPSRRLADAAGRVYGTEFLLASFGLEAPLPEGGRLRGVLGRPERSRPNSAGLRIAINGRAIRSRPLAQAVRIAFQDHLPKTRFPMGALQIELPPERIDVNVHPTKAEVRIAQEREILDAVRAAVRSALQSGPMGAEKVGVPTQRPAPEGSGITARLASMSPSLAAGPALIADALPGAQTRLDVGASLVGVAASARHPGLRLVGCLFDLYWIAEAPGELWIIDQHAASERLLYDRLRGAGRIGRQELVEPILVQLTARQRSVLEPHGEELRDSGFEVEPFGPEAHRVLAVPSYRGHTARADALGALLDEIADGGRPTEPEGGPERIAASIACHAAVRAGDPISPEAMRLILSGLDALDDPAFACPHGRPIALRWPRARLDRWFLRSGGGA
jgi:DNA mismatch repair protein MutL